jgi:S-methylmethionine-dependent homocysteine/selenocysteine methylase
VAKYRNNLPQLNGGTFLTDGGLETTMVFHKGIDLPEFSSITMLKDSAGIEELKQYFRTYAAIAKNYGTGFILESTTWRSSSDWGKKLGFSAEKLTELNRLAIEMLEEIRAEFETDENKFVISGNIGPRGDGYVPGKMMTAAEAEEYHSEQIEIFSRTNADMVSAFTMNYVEEAIGITNAAKSLQMPVVISFTVETDGKLPTGQTLREAIEQVDRETGNYPAYFMINCAHPTHFADILDDGDWTKRIRGLRANSSAKSHEELDNSTELDEGNPIELGKQHRQLLEKLPNVNIFGGCCGTDHRHVEEICKAVI